MLTCGSCKYFKTLKDGRPYCTKLKTVLGFSPEDPVVCKGYKPIEKGGK